MTDKEKIITELKEALDSVDITSDLRLVLIHAIECLQREPASEDLENEIERFLDEDENIPSYSKTARHFAEWQRKKDQQTIELAEDHAMLAGMEKMREEMMKDAVDATVHEGLSNKYIKEQNKDAFDKALANFEDGDRVKIIIVKEEQQ